MPRYKTMAAVAAAACTVGLSLVGSTPTAGASDSITNKFCTYTANTPLREHTSSWRVRGSEMWSCTPEGEASSGSKKLVVKLQSYDSYFGTWSDVAGTQKTSSSSDWGKAVTLATAAKCAKAKYRTVAWGLITDTNGKTIQTLPMAYSASKTITSCS
ncbi:MAG: hypothetical protein QM779_07950 [Propionicimonas sp.]|uniref:hypothetical protein n=1 Tax=Propionicimonas sp. TaxID=1955623 RepID=UPI003D1181D7